MSIRGIWWLAVALTLCAGAGCRSFTSPARATELKTNPGAYWLDYDATRRGAVLTAKDGKVMMLSEPAPDVALELTQKFLAKVDYQGVKGEASAELAESIIELGKRTQTVMFLRETLYRLAEMANNNEEISVDEQIKLYTLVVDAAKSLALAEVKAGETREKEAQTELAKAETKLTEAKADEARAQTYQRLMQNAVEGAQLNMLEQFKTDLQKFDLQWMPQQNPKSDG